MFFLSPVKFSNCELRGFKIRPSWLVRLSDEAPNFTIMNMYTISQKKVQFSSFFLACAMIFRTLKNFKNDFMILIQNQDKYFIFDSAM